LKHEISKVCVNEAYVCIFAATKNLNISPESIVQKVQNPRK